MAATISEVVDPDDPRVADYVRLTDPDLRRLREAGDGAGAGGFFIAEGVQVIRMLLRSTYGMRSLLVTPRRWDALRDDVEQLDRDLEVFVGSAAVVNEVSGFALHRGALAAADRPAPVPVGEVLGGAVVLVTEGINDHENLGSLFRNAAAFGASAVLLDPTSCDPLYRRSIRVSMGHVLHVPFTTLPPLPGGLDELGSAGYELVALTPAAGAVDIASLPPTSPDGPRRALLVGAEGPGLTAATLAACDLRVRIPMAPGVDSVNIATAAAIALHRLSPSGFWRQ